MTVKGTSISLFLLVVVSFPDLATPLGEVLKFPDTPSTSNYVILPSPDFDRLVTSFTVCGWIKPKETGNNQGVWFSYEISGNDISFSARGSGKWDRLFDDNMVSAASQLDDDVWSHFCEGWSFSTTTRTVYVNGTQIATKATSSGRKLQTGGVIVLGQEQDSRGGTFNANQAFAGELTNIQVFDKELTGKEVQNMYKHGLCDGTFNKSLEQNVVLDWTDFLQADRKGDVTLTELDQRTCSPWEMIRGVIEDDLLDVLIKFSDRLMKLEILKKCGTFSRWELVRGAINDDLLDHMMKYHPFKE